MDPEARFTALDALAHPYFDGFRDPDFEKYLLKMKKRENTKSRSSIRIGTQGSDAHKEAAGITTGGKTSKLSFAQKYAAASRVTPQVPVSGKNPKTDVRKPQAKFTTQTQAKRTSNHSSFTKENLQN